MEKKKDTGNKNDEKDIARQEQVQQRQQQSKQQLVQGKSKGKSKNKFSNKENEKYVNGLADGDLKYFLEYECKSETLVTILQVAKFQKIETIRFGYGTSKELIADAEKAGINVGLADCGAIELLFEKFKKNQQSKCTNKSKITLSFQLKQHACNK